MTNLRDVLKRLHESLALLGDEDLDKLEEALEEELQLVKTVRALRRVMTVRETTLGRSSESFILATDLDKDLHPERHPKADKRPAGEVTAIVVQYLETFGATPMSALRAHMHEKGLKWQAVSVAVRTGAKFCVENGVVRLASVPATPSAEENVA